MILEFDDPVHVCVGHLPLEVMESYLDRAVEVQDYLAVIDLQDMADLLQLHSPILDHDTTFRLVDDQGQEHVQAARDLKRRVSRRIKVDVRLIPFSTYSSPPVFVCLSHEEGSVSYEFMARAEKSSDPSELILNTTILVIDDNTFELIDGVSLNDEDGQYEGFFSRQRYLEGFFGHMDMVKGPQQWSMRKG